MTDILKQLSPASWRGIAFPVSSREYGFRQEHGEHHFIFRDNELIESLGRKSPTYSYTIPFREDIVIGTWANLFTSVYPEFLQACLDRTEGILEDPVHGAVQVKVASLRETVDVNRRDGVDVQVEFVIAPDLEDIQGELGTVIVTLQGAEGQAGLFDQEASKVDWQQEPSPEPSNDIFDTVSSVGDQLTNVGNKVTANMANLAQKMEGAEQSIDNLKNPKLAPMRQQARRVRDAAEQLQNTTQAPVNTTAYFETANEIGVIALAGTLKMAVKDFLALNPALASKRVVPRGVRVKYTESGQ